MSEQPNTPTPLPSESPTQHRGRGRRFAFVLALVAVAGLTGVLAAKAFSRGHGPWHGPHGFMSRPFDAATAEDRADRMVRHLAVDLDATNEQQDKLRVVVKGAVKDILPMREKVLSAREQGRKLLVEPTVNRAEIEKLRAEQVALADAFSKRVAQAFGDAAEILTPEQRKRLESHLPAGGAMVPMDGPGRGWNR